jgi:hypothetical protein
MQSTPEIQSGLDGPRQVPLPMDVVIYCDECRESACLCNAARACEERMHGLITVTVVKGVEARIRAGAILSPAIKIGNRWLAVGLAMGEDKLCTLLQNALHRFADEPPKP